jgi:hypothetical protein
MEQFMHPKPRSLLHSVAEYFHRDALDFAARFDCLWETASLMHKMGRTKSFVDLMMGCECALKCDGLLSGLGEDPVVVYKRVRACSHSIRDLLAHARHSKRQDVYQPLYGMLADIPVGIRYSRDAYDVFFPAFMEPEATKLKYSQTIGNDRWVMGIRAILRALNEAVGEEFLHQVSTDIEGIFQHQNELQAFAMTCRS